MAESDMRADVDVLSKGLGISIRKCSVPGTVALTFDDGPWFYTDYVLDSLAQFKAKATFFLNVWPNLTVNTRPEYWQPVIRRMLEEGHQIGIHTWGHENLDLLTDSERMTAVTRATDFFAQPEFLNGTRPMYIRPPFGECSIQTGCIEEFTKAGYRLVFWDFDSNDWRHDSGELVHLTTEALQEKLDSLSPVKDNLLVLMHDNRLQTGINVQDFLGRIKKHGFKPVTVGECIGDEKENWYEMAVSRTGFIDLELSRSSAAYARFDVREHTEFFGLSLLAIMSACSILWAMRRYKVLRRQIFSLCEFE